MEINSQPKEVLEQILKETESDPVSTREKRVRQAVEVAIRSLQEGNLNKAEQALADYYLQIKGRRVF